jgi:translation initiation factor 3 subunit K
MSVLETMRSRFDVSSLAALEASVKEQMEKGTYDLDVNLAVLQLYQLNPERARKDVVFFALARALMNVPNSDFMSAVCLVPEKTVRSPPSLSPWPHTRLQLSEEPVATLLALDNLFETAEYAAFWEAAERARAALGSIGGFFDAMRLRIAEVLLLVYRRLPRAYAQLSLHVDEAALAGLAAQRGWTLDGADLVLPEPPQAFSVKTAPAVDPLCPDRAPSSHFRAASLSRPCPLARARDDIIRDIRSKRLTRGAVRAPALTQSELSKILAVVH